MPVMKNRTASASDQPGSPAISGEESAQFGFGRTGWKLIVAPCNQRVRSGSPRSFAGVWHSAQMATSSTRYRPRAILEESPGFEAAALEFCAAKEGAQRTAAAMTSEASEQRVLFMSLLSQAMEHVRVSGSCFFAYFDAFKDL